MGGISRHELPPLSQGNNRCCGQRQKDRRGDDLAKRGHQSASRTVSSTFPRSASSTIIARVPARISCSAKVKAALGVSETLRPPILTARSFVTTGSDGICCPKE